MTTSSKTNSPPLSFTIAILTSLRNTSPTPSQDALLIELQKLELVLFRTEHLDHSVHSAQVTTLKEAVIQCRDAIIEFWERKILKGEGENDWRTMRSWQDINWDNYDEGDLINLEAELMRYKERVEGLLASMNNSDRQLASPATRYATAGILIFSQEELERGHGAQGVEGRLADLQIEGLTEESEDAKLESPKEEVAAVAASAPQEPRGGLSTI